jgi:peptidyl-prolyl cis-trans isomerase SurA
MKNYASYVHGIAMAWFLSFAVMTAANATASSAVKKQEQVKAGVGQSTTLPREKEYHGAVAIANGEIITFKDLDERVRMTIFAMGHDVASTLKSKIYVEVLDEMIMEILKLQYVKKFLPNIESVIAQDVDESFQDIAKRNKMTTDEFTKIIAQQKISKSTILKQICTNLAWMEYIRARFAKSVNVSNSEIIKKHEEMRERRNQECFHVCRMFFPIADRQDEDKVLVHVNNVRNMLLGGANFATIAQQFSKGPEAIKGGNVGWVFGDQLSPEEAAVARKMEIGSHVVVRNNRGYVILLLSNRKGEGEPSVTTATIAQVVVPFSETNPLPEVVNQLLAYIREMKKTSRNCLDFMQKAKNSGFMGVSESISVPLGERLIPAMQNMLRKLKAGEMSEPIVSPRGIIVLCVLEKKNKTLEEPTIEEIRNRKTGEMFNIFSVREEQNLKDRATIKIFPPYAT